MLVKSQVKYIQSLGHKKFRHAYGVFVAEGPKIVSELLQSDCFTLKHCFATENWIISNQMLLQGREQLLVRIKENDLERISQDALGGHGSNRLSHRRGVDASGIGPIPRALRHSIDDA
jgi:tRNA G18 (ribose-2'-O)-methylase SpoU